MGWSVIWSPKNSQYLKGPSNYFLYAVNLGKEYLKLSETDNAYQIQEMIFKDLYDALEYAKMNPKLVYMTNYIQFMITEAQKYEQFESCSLGWRVIENEILNIHVDQYKNQQLYIEAIKSDLKRDIKDFEVFEDWCMIASELENTKRLSLNGPFDFLFCCVGFKSRVCIVFEDCEFEFSLYNKLPMSLESFDLVFETGVIINFSYTGNQLYSFKPEKVQRYKIIAVKLNFNRPNLTLPIDETSLQHQQNSEANFSKMSLEFTRICQRTLKTMLQLRVDPLKPKVNIAVQEKFGTVLKGAEIEIQLTIMNTTGFPISFGCDLGKTVDLGPEESKIIVLKRGIYSETLQIKVNISLNSNICPLFYLGII